LYFIRTVASGRYSSSAWIVKRHDRKPSGNLNYDYRKASLWAENCPNFFFFLFGPAGKTTARESFFREIYPTLGYFNYGPEKLQFSLPPVGNLKEYFIKCILTLEMSFFFFDLKMCWYISIV
jgi:hypothetical protein